MSTLTSVSVALGLWWVFVSFKIWLKYTWYTQLACLASKFWVTFTWSQSSTLISSLVVDTCASSPTKKSIKTGVYQVNWAGRSGPNFGLDQAGRARISGRFWGSWIASSRMKKVHTVFLCIIFLIFSEPGTKRYTRPWYFDGYRHLPLWSSAINF